MTRTDQDDPNSAESADESDVVGFMMPPMPQQWRPCVCGHEALEHVLVNGGCYCEHTSNGACTCTAFRRT